MKDIIDQLASTQNPKLAPIATIRGKLQHELYSLGLSEAHATAVVAAYVADAGIEEMSGRWDDRVDGYPPIFWSLLRRGIDAVTVEWMEKNCPMHWARAMFDHELLKQLEAGEREEIAEHVRKLRI